MRRRISLVDCGHSAAPVAAHNTAGYGSGAHYGAPPTHLRRKKLNRRKRAGRSGVGFVTRLDVVCNCGLTEINDRSIGYATR